MATFACRVQFLDDTDPFNSTNFPEPTRPPQFTFREDIPLINQIAGVHRLLKAPHKLDDCALQLSHNGSYLDLESTLAEQRDEIEGFQEDGGRGKKHSIILRTQLSVRVHVCIEKLYNSTGRELRRALFSLKQIFQDDKDLVHEFVMAEGLTCLIKVGAEADQNYQNYILRALGQIMLYVDGMNGLIGHNETVQWLYTLVGSKFRLVVKTALKLLLVFVEYTESNAPLLIQAVNTVDTKQGCKPWSNAMEILDEKDGMDTELLVYAMTLINKTLAGLPDQDTFYDVVDSLEEQGMEAMAKRHVNRKGTDLDLVEQFNIYESTLRHEDGDDETQPPPSGHKSRRRASVGATPERRGLERRRSRRHSLQNGKGHTSAPSSPCHSHTPNILALNEKRKRQIETMRKTSGTGLGLRLSTRPQCPPLLLPQILAPRYHPDCLLGLRSGPWGPSRPGVPLSPPQPPPPQTKTPCPLSFHCSLPPFFLLAQWIWTRCLWALRRVETQTSTAGSADRCSRFLSTLGGLLTSSYRQHQESLNAERERRRLEREERLQRIEREERNLTFIVLCDVCRYKQLERLAAEENERERPRLTTRGRTEITLSLSSRTSSSSLSRSATPLTAEAQEDKRSVPHPTRGENPLYEKKEKPEGNFEEDADGTGTEECVREQMLERDVEEGAILSEKERQNEELNEKDNCSASSISSASSTLEREEREEKHVSDSDSGQWGDCMNTVDVNDQCNKVLNSKRFMLDMLYAQNKKGEEDEKEKENEKGCSGQDSSVTSLTSRISTLEVRRQTCEDNMKKLEVDHLDNQGSVRAVAEKFGDLVKGLVSPHEVEHSGKETQQSQEKPLPTPSPTPPKKESDHIWDQLIATPRELRIKELDFTDLGEEDDVDILDVSNVIGLPPPPPLFGCPPPPPIPGMMMPPPPPFLASVPPPHLGSPQLSRGEPLLFQKKKKTIRLFWNEVRPIDWQYSNHKSCRESLWSKLDAVKLDTAKLENLFETKSKELPVTKKTAADGKRQEIIILDSKRSNAINIGLTVLPPPRTIKTAILNFDEYALSKEGIEKILTMIPTEEETQKIQEAQLANPDTPLGSAEQFLLILSSISELSARLQLWAFKMDYDALEKEVAEPLQDLKEGMDQLEKNKTLRYILSTLLAIGNFLNGTNAKGFELSYLEKVPEVKDTVHKQSLLHHVCSLVVEKFPESSDLYSEIGAITRSAKVDFDQLQENLCQMEYRCKASWDHLKVIAKHEMKPALKQRMSDFLKDCAERIIILKIVHRRIINRFHSFLLFLGHPPYAIREVSIHRFSKILSEFALEYRTTRERVLQQKQKRANHRERNKTRGKMITESGKFAGTSLEGQEFQPQGLGYTEDAAEHEQMTAVLRTSLQSGDSPSSVLPGLRTRTRVTRGHTALLSAANEDTSNCTNDTADEIMERIVKSATQVPSQRTQPRERRRSRANRKSLRRTLKNGLTPEEAQALGLASSSEMQV
uniref:Formin homology 2 domain containing 3b n=1 Tax=Cyprinus carpio carpio TaxID=630221 RepID=A0A9J7ZH01_CYPCA